LWDTDICSHSLPILGDGVAHVTVMGRRGHVQGAFTIKELRELTKLREDGFGVSFHVRKDEMDLGWTAASQQELDGPAGRPKKRIHELLKEIAEPLAATDKLADSSGKIQQANKQLSLRFLLNPVRFQASEKDSSVLAGVVCERTKLQGNAGRQSVVGTGEMETIPADLVLVSIGYKGVAIPGTEPFFDEARGVVRSEHGRVDRATDSLGGLYASGWLKRGPSGVIGTNISDAKDTVATIMHDFQNFSPRRKKSETNLNALLQERGKQVVQWEDYKRLALSETTFKRSDKQPREKIVDFHLQLAASVKS
jgi:adrenodoxin-NADP+ reductase